MKETFIEIYQSFIKREGAQELLDMLLKSDFFEAPASTAYHLNEPGGLCKHSTNVFKWLLNIVNLDERAKNNSLESIAIVSLLHDVCKIGCYKIEYRNRKNENGAWEQYPYYTFKEDFAFGGHGAKSVFIISKYIKLTDEEAVAINCHMSVFDRPANDWTIARAFKQYPLALFLSWADQAATFITEEE